MIRQVPAISSRVLTSNRPATGVRLTSTLPNIAIPGIGRLTYEAVIYRDFPLLQAVIILKSILILTINLGVDILYAYVDPRIRLS